MQNTEITANSAILNTNIDPATLFNGTINYRLPIDEEWAIAYEHDKDCKLIKLMLEDPSKLTNENVSKIHFVYRAPMRQSLITMENGKLFFNKPTVIQNRSIKLIIVLLDLRKHIFHCFHTNPLGGHFGLYQTLHQIKLRFHWLGLFKCIKNMISTCPACLLKNGSAKVTSEFLYSFLLDAPMKYNSCIFLATWKE